MMHCGNETTIAGGLVIYKTTTDLVADTGSSTTNHEAAMRNFDQYVWIPVAKNGSGEIDWAKRTEDTTSLTSNHDATKEAALTLSVDFTAMDNSVKTYGGFYISRYELGCIVDNNSVVAASTSRKEQTVYSAYNSGSDQNGACWRSK